MIFVTSVAVNLYQLAILIRQSRYCVTNAVVGSTCVYFRVFSLHVMLADLFLSTFFVLFLGTLFEPFFYSVGVTISSPSPITSTLTLRLYLYP